MRSLLIATILCLPSIGSAQAMHAGVSHAVALMDAPAFAFQASAVRAVQPRIFSGLIAPVRLSAVKLLPANAPLPLGEVVVQYMVNTTGMPEDIHIVKSSNKVTDQRVIEAVSRVRYEPGKLNGEPVATPVTLHVAFTQ